MYASDPKLHRGCHALSFLILGVLSFVCAEETWEQKTQKARSQFIAATMEFVSNESCRMLFPEEMACAIEVLGLDGTESSLKCLLAEGSFILEKGIKPTTQGGPPFPGVGGPRLPKITEAPGLLWLLAHGERALDMAGRTFRDLPEDREAWVGYSGAFNIMALYNKADKAEAYIKELLDPDKNEKQRKKYKSCLLLLGTEKISDEVKTAVKTLREKLERKGKE